MGAEIPIMERSARHERVVENNNRAPLGAVVCRSGIVTSGAVAAGE